MGVVPLKDKHTCALYYYNNNFQLLLVYRAWLLLPLRRLFHMFTCSQVVGGHIQFMHPQIQFNYTNRYKYILLGIISKIAQFIHTLIALIVVRVTIST